MTQPNLIGLDVGTSRIVAARPSSSDFSFQSELNAFVSVPFSKMTENAMRREGISFDVRGEEILVRGNEAPRFADLLNLDTRRPMTLGVLNPTEADGVTVVRRIVESLTSPRDAESKPGICYSIPAAPLNGEEGLTYHEATLRQIFADMDYDLRSINEGLAVIYSELEDTNYTGIGVSCGGGLCNVAMAYLSMPVMSFSMPKAGDFIDNSAAAVTGDLASRVRIDKEERFYLNGHFVDKLQQVLTVYYEDVINSLITAMRDAFSDSRRMPKLSRPIPIVLSGGTAIPKGFRDRFEKALRTTDFPIQISEVRMARDPLTATARGALIAAMTEMSD